MANLILRAYRISLEDDKKVKLNSKKYGGEGAYIRALIRKGKILPDNSKR